MKLLPSISDIIDILIYILLFGFGLGAINYVSFKLTGFAAFLNMGYSMCSYEDPLLEILPINHPNCSWVPINLLVLNPYIDKYNLQIGDNVCYKKNNALICHRIFDKKVENGKVYYYIKGLHPKALKEWVPADAVYAKVIDKFPRAVGGPFLIFMFALGNPLAAYIYINKGYYL